MTPITSDKPSLCHRLPMTFGDKRDRHPDLLCACGHTANRHLYCGEHYCIVADCPCEGFTPEVRETWLAPVPLPWAQPVYDVATEPF